MPVDPLYTDWSSLRRSRVATWLARLGGRPAVARRWSVAGQLISLICKREGGQCFSRTAREYLAKHYEVYIGAYSYGGCFRPGAFPPRSYVGRYSSLAAGIRSIERNHPYDRPSTSSFFYDPGLGVVDSDTLPEYEPLVIGHDVWIGWNAILLPGCRQIGTGCIIGAGAVVTRDAPAYSIVAGTPGRVLKYRFDEEIREDLLKTGWWRLEPSELSGLQSSFTQSLNAETKKNFPLSILASNES